MVAEIFSQVNSERSVGVCCPFSGNGGRSRVTSILGKSITVEHVEDSDETVSEGVPGKDDDADEETEANERGDKTVEVDSAGTTVGEGGPFVNPSLSLLGSTPTAVLSLLGDLSTTDIL
ncbi:hypothetical protein ONZ51_g8249 [Trametes cubensis]|uniref:Uncharacterized protein n=1 Tax=Trametes cubensis TaxID=1111947 RepID=A0AAD7TR31_9APHY|nr:hypothetical protein ONZ51_g8249 [Trametes cubensis]